MTSWTTSPSDQQTASNPSVSSALVRVQYEVPLFTCSQLTANDILPRSSSVCSYGSVAEAWFDGAKGEDAESMEYDFPAWNALVRQLQPLCNIFSGAGPDVRWVGNERAEAGATCWSPLNISNSDPVGLHPE